MIVASSGRHLILFAAAVVVSLFAASCGRDNPNGPSAASLTGTWTSSDQQLRWELRQSGTAVTGTEIVVETGLRTAIAGTVADGQFEYRVVTQETTEYFTPETPVRVQWGWAVSAAVQGDRMIGSMYWFGAPGQYPRTFHSLTIVKVDRGR
jgi:hypothetical protein